MNSMAKFQHSISNQVMKETLKRKETLGVGKKTPFEKFDFSKSSQLDSMAILDPDESEEEVFQMRVVQEEGRGEDRVTADVVEPGQVAVENQ